MKTTHAGSIRRLILVAGVASVAMAAWPSASGAATRSGAVAVTTGNRTACAIQRVTRVPVCWGDNTYGGLDVPAGIGPVTSIRADHTPNDDSGLTCAIRSANGKVACWGLTMRNGEAKGVNVPPTLGRVSRISVNYGVVCAIQASTSLLSCFGNDMSNSITGVPLSLGRVSSVSVAFGYVCAIRKATGTLACFGNISTVPGNPSAPDPHPSDLGQVAHVESGASTTCAVQRPSGNPVCWGDTYHYDGYPSLAIPSDIGAVSAVSLAWHVGCAIRQGDSTPICWPGAVQQGNVTIANNYWFSGDTSGDPAKMNSFARVPAVSQISVASTTDGGGGACAITKSNWKVVCWTDVRESWAPAKSIPSSVG